MHSRLLLEVTNYRFRKSMGWEIKPALLYQAYVPASECFKRECMEKRSAFSARWCWILLDGSCAEVPTVVRDILYGWARGFVAVALSAVWKPQTFVQEARLVCGDAWHRWAFLGGLRVRLRDLGRV